MRVCVIFHDTRRFSWTDFPVSFYVLTADFDKIGDSRI